MDFRDIKRIVELMDQHGLSVFKLEQNETKLELKKGGDLDVKAIQSWLASAPPPQFAPAYAAPPASAEGATASTPAEGGLPANVKEITSPMVGTFYRKPAPDAPNFAEVGTTVSEGQTLCIIEAMKVMNEIKAEKSGTICAVVAEDGKPVQYGDVLFRIK